MEDLIKLVAASLARHGVECPADDSNSVWRRTTVEPGVAAGACGDAGFRLPAQAAEPGALPEHNFRNSSLPDRTP